MNEPLHPASAETMRQLIKLHGRARLRAFLDEDCQREQSVLWRQLKPGDEKEDRMVMAHKQGRRKAQLGFVREYVVDLAKLLPTADERDAFIAGFDGEKRRLTDKKAVI